MEFCFFLPFLACRLYEALKDRKGALAGFLQDTFVISEFLLIASFFPKFEFLFKWIWFCLTVYQLIGWYCDYKLQIPLTRKLWSYALKPRSFVDSVKELKIPRLAILGIIFTLCSMVGFEQELDQFFWLILLIACGTASKIVSHKGARNPLFALQWDFLFQKKLFEPQKQEWRFPSEFSSTPNPKYPIFRKTLAFQGKKQFDLTLKEKPHLIFIVLESFRAKNIGCLGATLPLSPHFDALAKEGILFSQFHSASNLTSCCLIASLFGISPAPVHGHLGQYVNMPLHGLPKILSGSGYHSALIQGGHISFDHGAEFFQAQGFKTLIGKRDIEKERGASSGSSWGIHDEHLMNYAASWLEKQSSPTFLTLFTITNHHPWTIPADWAPPPEAKGTPFYESYAYTDWALGLFIEQLRQKKLLEKSVLFIFGDHGQESRDSEFEINRNLYQENVHVPLLICAPKRIKKPVQIDTPCSQIDLLPTVLDLLHLPGPHHSLGRSLIREGSQAIYFSHPFDAKMRGCREGKWKLLVHGEKNELYDLQNDPDERRNLAVYEPLKTDELKRNLILYFSQLEHLYNHQILTEKIQASSKASDVLYLELSNSLRISDDTLEEIGKTCPNLATLNLSHCPLVSDQGIRSLLKNCASLEKLSLQGLDLTGKNWPEAPYLMHLKASDCLQLSGDFWVPWINSLTSLKILQLNLELSDQDLQSLAEKTHQLGALQLTGMSSISNLGLIPLLKTNPNLMSVCLENCIQISDAALGALKGTTLCNLSLTGSPQITDEGIERLSSLPLQHLIIQNCPQITGLSLKKIKAKGVRILIAQCPGILREEVDSLQEMGMNIWWDQQAIV